MVAAGTGISAFLGFLVIYYIPSAFLISMFGAHRSTEEHKESKLSSQEAKHPSGYSTGLLIMIWRL
jgi:hypothetical protein